MSVFSPLVIARWACGCDEHTKGHHGDLIFVKKVGSLYQDANTEDIHRLEPYVTSWLNNCLKEHVHQELLGNRQICARLLDDDEPKSCNVL
jgi:hypothetical protein